MPIELKHQVMDTLRNASNDDVDTSLKEMELQQYVSEDPPQYIESAWPLAIREECNFTKHSALHSANLPK